MTNFTLRQALAYAARGWPVFPCQANRKIPATTHGYRDATTDAEQIADWFLRRPGYNLAIATGLPGPDVLDVDHHGCAGSGYPAFGRLSQAGLLDGAAACVQTPGGGMHVYFAGSDQRNGHLPAHHLDFRSTGGYVLAPPSRIRGHPYKLIKKLGGRSSMDWTAATRLLQPQRQFEPSAQSSAPSGDLSHLARWVAAQGEGNRNNGLYWAANRALEADPAADLRPLADAARQAGLADQEINRTLDSARRAGQARPEPHGYQAEAVN
jgi:hypothetical protein